MEEQYKGFEAYCLKQYGYNSSDENIDTVSLYEVGHPEAYDFSTTQAQGILGVLAVAVWYMWQIGHSITTFVPSRYILLLFL